MTKQLSHDKVGTIKRVLKQDGTFVCGLCVSRYSDFGEAQSCLERCWQTMLDFVPYVLRHREKTNLFRCRFCARDYETKIKAKQCADACLNAAKLDFDKEQSMIDYVAPKRIKAQRPKFQAIVAVRPKNKTKEIEMNKNPDEGILSQAPVPNEASPIAADVSPPQTPSESSVGDIAKKKERETDEGFHRDGARYVCQVCHKKYFTKDEVVACFKSHS